jgi:hypothetical protein
VFRDTCWIFSSGPGGTTCTPPRCGIPSLALTNGAHLSEWVHPGNGFALTNGAATADGHRIGHCAAHWINGLGTPRVPGDANSCLSSGRRALLEALGVLRFLHDEAGIHLPPAAPPAGRSETPNPLLDRACPLFHPRRQISAACLRPPDILGSRRHSSTSPWAGASSPVRATPGPARILLHFVGTPSRPKAPNSNLAFAPLSLQKSAMRSGGEVVACPFVSSSPSSEWSPIGRVRPDRGKA